MKISILLCLFLAISTHTPKPHGPKCIHSKIANEMKDVFKAIHPAEQKGRNLAQLTPLNPATAKPIRITFDTSILKSKSFVTTTIFNYLTQSILGVAAEFLGRRISVN